MIETRFYPTAPDLDGGVVEMAHGSGGRATHQLVFSLFANHFENEYLSRGNDQAQLPESAGRLVTSVDAYVISPLFFPGGNIGDLAVNGTLNDLAMAGAQPRYLTAAFILEEGLPLADLDRIADSMGQAARKAGVRIVAGDTKVVERGKADGVFIATTGIGFLSDFHNLSGDRARPGDRILVSGPIGDHGVAVMACREGLRLDAPIQSDTACLYPLVRRMLEAAPTLRCMRDPTRGGLGTTLNELAQQSGVGMLLDEAFIPVRPEVETACELLGLDPLYVANEGRLVAICPPSEAPALLAAMRAHPLGEHAAIIGEVCADEHRFVRMSTPFGGTRIVDWLSGSRSSRIS